MNPKRSSPVAVFRRRVAVCWTVVIGCLQSAVVVVCVQAVAVLAEAESSDRSDCQAESSKCMLSLCRSHLAHVHPLSYWDGCCRYVLILQP